MKKRKHWFTLTSLLLFISVVPFHSCKTASDPAGKKSGDDVAFLTVNPGGGGIPIQLAFTRGKYFNHPSFAVWLEDSSGRFIQTLFVTAAFGRGTYLYGEKAGGRWKPGHVRRPASLPVWSHRTGTAMGTSLYIPSRDHPVPDAYTGATPKGSFTLKMKSDRELPPVVKLFLEINQTWDWNGYWTNNKYPGDTEYKTSCQPALVYSAEINTREKSTTYSLTPAGRSSYNGSDGVLYNDLETLSTALRIAEKITVTVAGD